MAVRNSPTTYVVHVLFLSASQAQTFGRRDMTGKRTGGPWFFSSEIRKRLNRSSLEGGEMTGRTEKPDGSAYSPSFEKLSE